MNFKELKTASGTKFFLGRDEKTNDQLMEKFEGKENTILHTVLPGSPFCVLDLEYSKEDLKEASLICASKSQDWRDHKKSVKLHLFSGKDIYKAKKMKTGTWGIRGKAKRIRIKKKEIKQWQSSKKFN